MVRKIQNTNQIYSNLDIEKLKKNRRRTVLGHNHWKAFVWKAGHVLFVRRNYLLNYFSDVTTARKLFASSNLGGTTSFTVLGL